MTDTGVDYLPVERYQEALNYCQKHEVSFHLYIIHTMDLE